VQLPILVEPVNGSFRARLTAPFALSADGDTRDAAVAKLQQEVQARLSQGVQIVPLEVPPLAHPLAEFAGMFKGDPDFDDVQNLIAENRRRMNDDPNVP
jgi:hypothetical protein